MNGFNVTKTNGININLISSEINKDDPLIQVTDPKNWPINGYRKTFLSESFESNSFLSIITVNSVL